MRSAEVVRYFLRIRGDEHDDRIRPALLDELVDVETARALRKLDIDERHIGRCVVLQTFDIVKRRGFGYDFVPFVFDHELDIHGQKRLVLDDQDTQRRSRTIFHERTDTMRETFVPGARFSHST